MLAKLTQIDAMMDLANGKDLSIEKDNVNSKNNKFSLIEDNEIERNESVSHITADNISDYDDIKTRKENINQGDYIEEETVKKTINNKDKGYKAVLNNASNTKDNTGNNEKEANLVDKTNLQNDIINGTKGDISNKNKKNRQKHNQLIKNVFNIKSNTYRAEKQLNKLSMFSGKNGKTKNKQKEIISNIYTNKPGKKGLIINQNCKVTIEENNILVTKNSVKEEEIKGHINELKSDKNELNVITNPSRTNIIKQVYDETKKLQDNDTKVSKHIQNNKSKLNNNENNNSKIISDLKNIYNKSKNTEEKTIDSSFDKLNRSKIKETTEKVKIINKQDSKNTTKINQIINNSGNQADITNKTTRVEVSQANINITERNVKSDISSDISKQILESIHSSVSRQGIDKQITVRLNPPELGKVFIKFQEQDTQITGIIEVSKSQTRLEVEQALPQIIRNMNDCGIQIRKLEVVSADVNQSGQGSLKEQLLSSDNSEQQSSTYQDAGKGESDNNRLYKWLSNKTSGRSGSGLENVFIGSESINILI